MRQIILIALACPLWAATQIGNVTVTAEQAVIPVTTTADAKGCTIAASEGASLGTPIPDITNNGNTTARVGTLVGTGTVTFVLGLRRGNNALSEHTTFTTGITCAPDAQVTKTFRTGYNRWGNTSPEPVPFKLGVFNNSDYPAWDWADLDKPIIDPITGGKTWRVDKPGWLAGIYRDPTSSEGQQSLGTPIDLSGSGWSNLANLTTNGASYAIASGTSANKVFLPMGYINGCNSNPDIPFSGFTNNSGCSIDDWLLDVYCNNSGQGTLQLSVDGGQSVVGSPVSFSCTASGTPAKAGTFPQVKPSPPFRSWGYTPSRNMFPGSGTVSVATSIVTLDSLTKPQHAMDLDYPSGTPILINGTYYHVASVQGSKKWTITENAGTLSAKTFVGARLGVVITKTAGTNVSLSLGGTVAQSALSFQEYNGDVPLFNPVSVSVTKDKDGNNLPSPLTGYITRISPGIGGSGWFALTLWIPYNADGSYRMERRLISRARKISTSPDINAHGDSLLSYVALSNPVFDSIHGDQLLGSGQIAGYDYVVWRMTYDPTLHAGACAGFPEYVPHGAYGLYDPGGAAPLADDCFRYENLTPAADGKKPLTQLRNAYVSGQNILGQTVGPAHPGFNTGWLTNDLIQNFYVNDYFTASIANVNNGLGIFAGFRLSDGVLTTVRSTWEASGGLTWGGSHACVMELGTLKGCAMDIIEDTGYTNVVFPNRFLMGISKVNRADYGVAAVWDCSGCPGGPNQNTSVAAGEYYKCPSSMPAPFTSFANQNYCLQIEATSEPCQHTPNATFDFGGGQHEKDVYPCTTPGFGNANPNWSKLQDITVGDWLTDSTSNGNSSDAVVAVDVQGTSAVRMWLLKHAGKHYLHDTVGLPCCDDSLASKSDPWSAIPAPSFAMRSVAAFIDPSTTNSNWIIDTAQRSGGHGSPGYGTDAGHLNYVGIGDSGYVGQINMAPGAMLGQPMNNIAPSDVPWYGLTPASTGSYQSYATSNAAPGAGNSYFVDLRMLASPGGGGNDPTGVAEGNAITITPVGGSTTKSYCTSDGLVPGSNAYKNMGLGCSVGRLLLNDVSNPSTSNTNDLPDYSCCYAYKTNQCFQGTAANQVCFTSPKFDQNTHFLANQQSQASANISKIRPWGDQATQFKIAASPDMTGKSTRKFGYLGLHWGMHYGFQNCRVAPNRDFITCFSPWGYDGVSSHWVMTPLTNPSTDAVDRTTYLDYTVQVAPSAYPNVRGQFGYLEYGSPSDYRCTAYQDSCVTATNGTPFNYLTSDSSTWQSCASGCTVHFPVLPNRVVYARIQHLDVGGAVQQSLDPIVFTSESVSGDIPLPLVTGAATGSHTVIR